VGHANRETGNVDNTIRGGDDGFTNNQKPRPLGRGWEKFKKQMSV
jgi:hypothetical protein